jgi:P27 family predicted phage terminase small subunit
LARPREPVDLLLVKEKKHLTKEEIANRKSTEVSAPADKVRAPSYLSKKLKVEFDSIAQELIDIGIMSNLDCDALARYLLAKDMYVKITNRLSKMKPTRKAKMIERIDGIEKVLDVEVPNEAFADILISQDKLFKQCRVAAGDLGLTISSRCKLVVPKKPEEKPPSKFSRFGAGNSG